MCSSKGRGEESGRERQRERSARKQSVKGRRDKDVGENRIRNHGDTQREVKKKRGKRKREEGEKGERREDENEEGKYMTTGCVKVKIQVKGKTQMDKEKEE